MTTFISFSESTELPAEEYLVQNGILKGSNGDFGLNNSISRLEGIILILRYLGLEETALAMQNEPSVFNDVPSWAVGYTNLAANYQVTAGTGEGEFSPHLRMTRSQFFLLMLRAVGAVEPTSISQAPQVAQSVGLVDQDLLELSNDQEYYKGDVVNVLSRLIRQNANDEAVTLKYWSNPNVMDPVALAAFQKDMLSIFNTVKAKYKLNYNMVGMYVEELNTGYKWSFGDDLVYDKSTGLTKGKFGTASAVKFPLAMSVLTHMESKGLKLSDTFKDPLSGKTLRFEQALKPMISQSTNDSYNYLFRFMGRTQVNAYLTSVGVKNSVINGELGGGDPYWSLDRMRTVYGTTNSSRFTPSDYGILLRHFYELVQKKNPYMLYLNQIMIDNIHQSRIPRGINYKYTVAHKTGSYTDAGRYVDVGIVYLPNNPYSLAIILDAQTLHVSCEPFMRELTATINTYFEKRIIK